jgi:hypothetical protein
MPILGYVADNGNIIVDNNSDTYTYRYETKSGEVIRFTNIDARLDTYNGPDPKSVISHDIIRTMLIAKCYEFTYDEIMESPTVFKCAMLTSLNNEVGNTGVKCESFEIETMEKVY